MTDEENLCHIIFRAYIYIHLTAAFEVLLLIFEASKRFVHLERKIGPIKGPVKRKNTSPYKKKYIFFSLVLLLSHQHSLALLSPFSLPLFLSYRFVISILLIHASHPSGSRQLCFKRNA